MHRHAAACQSGKGHVVGRSAVGVSNPARASLQGVQYIVDEQPLAWGVTGETWETTHRVGGVGPRGTCHVGFADPMRNGFLGESVDQ